MSETGVFSKSIKNPSIEEIKQELNKFIEIKEKIKDQFVKDLDNDAKDKLNDVMNNLIENPQNRDEIEKEYAEYSELSQTNIKDYLNSALPLFSEANSLENKLIEKISNLFGISISQSFLLGSLKTLLDKIRTSNEITSKDIEKTIKKLSSSLLLTQVLSKLPMIPVAGPIIDAIYKAAEISSSTGDTLGALKQFLIDANVPEKDLTILTSLQNITENNPLVKLYNSLMFLKEGNIDETINALKNEIIKHFPLNQICHTLSPVIPDDTIIQPTTHDPNNIVVEEKEDPTPPPPTSQNGGKIKSIKNKKRYIRRTLNTINNTILNYLKRTSRRFQPFRKTIASRKVKRSF
jgi:hypothetical protein